MRWHPSISEFAKDTFHGWPRRVPTCTRENHAHLTAIPWRDTLSPVELHTFEPRAVTRMAFHELHWRSFAAYAAFWHSGSGTYACANPLACHRCTSIANWATPRALTFTGSARPESSTPKTVRGQGTQHHADTAFLCTRDIRETRGEARAFIGCPGHGPARDASRRGPRAAWREPAGAAPLRGYRAPSQAPLHYEGCRGHSGEPHRWH